MVGVGETPAAAFDLLKKLSLGGGEVRKQIRKEGLIHHFVVPLLRKRRRHFRALASQFALIYCDLLEIFHELSDGRSPSKYMPSPLAEKGDHEVVDEAS